MASTDFASKLYNEVLQRGSLHEKQRLQLLFMGGFEEVVCDKVQEYCSQIPSEQLAQLERSDDTVRRTADSQSTASGPKI